MPALACVWHLCVCDQTWMGDLLASALLPFSLFLPSSSFAPLICLPSDIMTRDEGEKDARKNRFFFSWSATLSPNRCLCCRRSLLVREHQEEGGRQKEEEVVWWRRCEKREESEGSRSRKRCSRFTNRCLKNRLHDVNDDDDDRGTARESVRGREREEVWKPGCTRAFHRIFCRLSLSLPLTP